MSHAYLLAVRRAGGLPLLLPPDESGLALLEMCRGVVVPGGDDIPGEMFGSRSHESLRLERPERIAADLEIIRRALTQDLPLLGICFGAQLLAIERGGTLVQDIPSEMPEALEHKADATDRDAEHGIVLDRAVWGEAAGESAVVNSRHHQAIADPGRGVRATAHAPDGVVEAVIVEEHRYCVGVQWHPERLDDGPLGLELFRNLCRIAGG